MGVQPKFYNHEIVQKSPDDYAEMILSPQIILKAWSSSMFAHELLHQDGSVKDMQDLQGDSLRRYVEAMESLKRQDDVAKPIIGVGIMDGIEVGIGREIIAAANVLQIQEIPVHIRKAQWDDVQAALG